DPPDLTRGLGWEVKNDLEDNTKLKEGKGQLIKYARIYLLGDTPLSQVFYGCIMDGTYWVFVKITYDYDKCWFEFEKSQLYKWSVDTALLIAGLINLYHTQVLPASGEKQDYPGRDDKNQGCQATASSVSPEMVLADLIKEGVSIQTDFGEFIQMQIISHLGTGRDSIIFLAEALDYGIMQAVLKIEVPKDTNFSQLSQETRVLHELDGLACVPKILFEGWIGSFRTVLMDFVGQPLESWITNHSMNTCKLHQLILDLLSCLKEIHAQGYVHGDVAVWNIIQRNGHFYLIDYGFAGLSQLVLDPYEAVIQDYVGLCETIGVIKFGRKMSLSMLTDKLDGEMKRFVTFVKNAHSNR
ncbi:1939_t:CDS:2, partial [Paraglomus brasilianum]